MFRMQGLIDAAQERVALDELGAPGERVLPDRAVPAPVAPTGPPGPAAHDEPAPSPGEPPASRDEPVPTGATPTGAAPTGPSIAPAVTGDPVPAPSRANPPEPQAPSGENAKPAMDHGSDR